MSHGDITTFNIHHGYAEAIVRGYRSGFLSDVEYHHMAECATLDDLKANLQETDYGEFMASEPPPLTNTAFKRCARRKLAREFEYLRASSTGSLSKFLDFMKYEFMLENVRGMLSTMAAGNTVLWEEVEETLDPLGMFPSLRTIAAFDPTSSPLEELYSTVLVEVPVGRYFAQFLADATQASGRADADAHAVLSETHLTKLTFAVQKLYMEHFAAFCDSLGGETAEAMRVLLGARADENALNITLNSVPADGGAAAGGGAGGGAAAVSDVGAPMFGRMGHAERTDLYPALGSLYPEGVDGLLSCKSLSSVGDVLAPYPELTAIWSHVDDSDESDRTLTDLLYMRTVRLCENAFLGQSQFAAFYAWLKLKEQEVRNIGWIADCIEIRRPSAIASKIIIPFSADAPWRHDGRVFF